MHAIHVNTKAIVLTTISFKQDFYVGLWESPACCPQGFHSLESSLVGSACVTTIVEGSSMASACLSLQHLLWEASCHVMRTLKQPDGESTGRETGDWLTTSTRAKHLGQPSMSDTERNLSAKLVLDPSPTQIVWHQKCLLFEAAKFRGCYTATDYNSGAETIK